MFLSLGFSILKDDAEIKMVIDASARTPGRFITGENRPIDPMRKAAIKKEFLWFAYRLQLIRSELEFSEGISFLSEEIGDIIKQLKGL